MLDTPNSTEGVDVVMADMTVEEAMDMEPDSENEDEDEDDDEVANGEGSGPEMGDHSSPAVGTPPTEPSVMSAKLANDPMELHHASADQPSDPRRRPLETNDFGWEPHERTNGVLAS